jgi:hypothetical protein
MPVAVVCTLQGTVFAEKSPVGDVGAIERKAKVIRDTPLSAALGVVGARLETVECVLDTCTTHSEISDRFIKGLAFLAGTGGLEKTGFAAPSAL